MDHPIRVGGLVAAALTLTTLGPAQVTLVEAGHTLTLHMDSMAPLHPSQTLLEATLPLGDIESICVDRQTGDLFFQLIFPAGSPVSATTHVFRLSPAAGGLVTPVALNTGFGINERGTDLQLDPRRNLLVTQDQNWRPAERIAFVNPMTGATGTWSLVTTPPIFLSGTFGMDFSAGTAGSVVPAGDIVFTSDAGASGIHAAAFAGPASLTHVPIQRMPPGAGDDLVVQPDGDWIWIGDNGAPIVQILPAPPHLMTPSALNLMGMCAAAAIPFTAGTRAAVCDLTGVIYVTNSAATGGCGLFRVDERLTRSSLILTVGLQGAQGIHDLEVGPASTGRGNSIWFTVHDYRTGGEQIWEVSATACCPTAAGAVVVPDPAAVDAPFSIAPFPAGTVPQIGTTFGFHLDDPGNVCAITPGSPTFVLLNFWPGTLMIPGLGCGPAVPGHLMLAMPTVVATGPVPWTGPGPGAVHWLPIPFVSSLCGLQVFTQGIWLDGTGPSAPLILSWRLDLTLGH
jgi:hypothetical protein